ncbi:MAG: hypothetical protein KH034_02845 [Lachnospiraceae bacterium]|nr:hypothetical protein [Lachnospiraceae bacterium]
MKKIKQAKRIKKVREFLPFPMSVMAARIMRSHYRRKNRTEQEKQEDRDAFIGASVMALIFYGMFLYWIFIGY